MSVLHADLNEGLRWFPDESFDYVVLEETLQTVQSPRVVLSELLRVGRRGIVSFPNFANWRVIVDFVAHGRMPVTSGLPFPWYASENIHPFTLQDLLDWADSSACSWCRDTAMPRLGAPAAARGQLARGSGAVSCSASESAGHHEEGWRK